MLERVPITRVYDATALDRLNWPVWAAVTPLARDLTVHAGKGTSHRAARCSAVMEAIERVSAEDVPGERVRRSSFLRLRGREPVLDPGLCGLPYRTAYAPDRECSWVQAEDLMGGPPVWVALDLVLSPAREGVCLGPETNGLASGNVRAEALLHALYEVIERDAAAHERFGRRHGAALAQRLIDPASLPTRAAARLAALERAGVSLRVRELTHDLGVPVFGATLEDRGFPGCEGASTTFSGFGADLDAELALIRAVAEAVQAHTAVLVGARESFEDGSLAAGSTSNLVAWLAAGADTHPFVPTPAGEVPGDLGMRLELVLERLWGVGLRRCLAIELTRPDLGIPVFRVLVPGAAGPYGETARRPPLRLLRALV